MKRAANTPLPLKDAAIAYNQFGEAIRHEIEPYLVRLCGLVNDEPHEVGTGTCIAIGTRFLVFTAAHVIRDYSASNLWLLKKVGAMKRRPLPVRKNHRGGAPGEALDVGYVELTQAQVADLGLKALPISRVTVRPIIPDEFIAVAGIPGDTMTWKDRGPNKDDVDLAWNPFIAVTMAKDPATWHPAVDKTVEIEADYPKNFASVLPGGADQKLNDAPGMSGGGYWLCNFTKRDEVWSATQLQLAGTINTWHETQRYITANKMAHTLSLLMNDYPDLKPTLAAVK